MYRIVSKKALNPSVVLMDIEAPRIARSAEPGQFIILRTDEDGERIPLTIAGYDRAAGTVRIIFQVIGATTERLSHMQQGDMLHDFAGPLGKKTELAGLHKVCVVGGGVGCAIALPIAQKLHELGCEVHSIIGFRSKDLVILEDEFRAASSRLSIMRRKGCRYHSAFRVDRKRRELRRGHSDRSADHDEICRCNDTTVRNEDRRLHESDHDRRNGHVRRLPSDRWRKNEVCLR